MDSAFGGRLPIISFRDLIPLRHRALESDARQTPAIGERLLSDACDAIRDGDARQAYATIECAMFNACDAIRDDDARQACATGERTSYARDAVRDRDARQSRATEERAIADALDTTI